MAQVVERGYTVCKAAERLEISTKSLYTWKTQFAESPRVGSEVADQAAEITRLKRELIRVPEERAVLKTAIMYVARESQGSTHSYTARQCMFSCARGKAHRAEFSVRSMCRVLAVHFRGFYAWVKEPFSQRTLEDARQTELTQQAWTGSSKVNGYRKLHDDLFDQGETCSKNRVARLASLGGIVDRLQSPPWSIWWQACCGC